MQGECGVVSRTQTPAVCLGFLSGCDLPICGLHSAVSHLLLSKCQACTGTTDEESMFLPPGDFQSDT